MVLGAGARTVKINRALIPHSVVATPVTACSLYLSVAIARQIALAGSFHARGR